MTDSRQPTGRTPATTRRRWTARLAAAVLLPASFGFHVSIAPPAKADTVPPDANVPSTVSSDPLPTAQINGVVYAQVIAGNTVYAAGEFSRARPANAAAGTQEVVRTNILAYNLTTGVLTSFAPTVNAKIKDMALSPDATTLYIAGQFTTVNGANRYRIAAFNASTGALLPFAPTVNSTINGLAVGQNAIFIGGTFTSVGGVARKTAAAINRTTGATTGFNPDIPTGTIQKVAVKPDGTKVVIGGNFETVNGSGNPGYGLAMLDATTGGSLPLPVNSLIRNARTNAGITDLTAAADGFYGSGYAFRKADGNLEGAFKADWNGNLAWVEDCHGDTYSVFPAGNEVYTTGHTHYCGNVGGFPQTEPDWTFHRALAWTNDARGLVSKEALGYFNYEGKPRPQLLAWFPDINTGTYTGTDQGAWNISGNADYVIYGGEFTRVNNRQQQGLARFARDTIPPHDDGPLLSGSNYVPTATSFAQGIRINWLTNHDRDNEQLTYSVIKNGNTSSPIYDGTRRSTFWQQPYAGYLDQTVSNGQSYSYRIRVTDPKGNSVDSDTITVTANGGPSLSAYDQAALADGPRIYWPLNETSGSTATDVASGVNGNRGSGVTDGVPGAISGDPGTAYRFAGNSSGTLVTPGPAEVAPQIFSLETWFKTTTSSGGKLIGFGNAASGNSTAYDRHIYMTNAGRINFGVNNGNQRTISSPNSYRDGHWHHVVGTLSPAGLYLYVDGALVASRTDAVYAQIINSGYWRVGGDSISNWASAPSSAYFNGDLDNVAIYHNALTAAQVSAHYAARNGTVPNMPPNAAFTSSASGLTASFDGSGSTDSDGTITSYEWDFGDGDTGTGVSPTHTYASAGTRTVTLTVTDNDGDTDSVTHNITVSEPSDPGDPFVADEFNRTLATGLGSADIGGTWSVSDPNGFSVGSGAGHWRLTSAGVTRTANLPTTQRNSTDLVVNLSSDKNAAGGTIYTFVEGRRVSSNTIYRSVIRLTTSNSLSVGLEALKGSTTATTLVAPVTVGAISAGTPIHVRMQTFGTNPTTVRTKVWLGGASEPSSWTASTTDTYAGLQVQGAVGLVGYLSGSATNAPVTLSVLDLEARPVE
jgi:PKD repeat protein